MRFSIVCRSLAKGERPGMELGSLVTADQSAELLSRQDHELPVQAAMWAAVEATHLQGAWSLFDLRSRGARGKVQVMEHWFGGDEEEIRSGFLLLVRLNLVEGDVRALRFTDAGIELVTS